MINRNLGPAQFILTPGMVSLAIGLRRIFKVKDVRKSDIVLFSDRYASWHLGPFALQVWKWPRSVGTRQRADAWMARWRKER
jgi:hypothetical protein